MSGWIKTLMFPANDGATLTAPTKSVIHSTEGTKPMTKLSANITGIILITIASASIKYNMVSTQQTVTNGSDSVEQC